MSVTRDPDYPVHYAKLFQAFNQCADGIATDVIIDVTTNFLVAAVGYHVREGGGSMDRAVEIAHSLGDVIAKGVVENWDRKAQPNDMEVKLD